jgi:hypothetical protein
MDYWIDGLMGKLNSQLWTLNFGLWTELKRMVAGAGIAPAFAPSKGAVLLLDDPASNGDGLMDWWISELMGTKSNSEDQPAFASKAGFGAAAFARVRRAGESWWSRR